MQVIGSRNTDTEPAVETLHECWQKGVPASMWQMPAMRSSLTKHLHSVSRETVSTCLSSVLRPTSVGPKSRYLFRINSNGETKTVGLNIFLRKLRVLKESREPAPQRQRVAGRLSRSTFRSGENRRRSAGISPKKCSNNLNNSRLTNCFSAEPDASGLRGQRGEPRRNNGEQSYDQDCGGFVLSAFSIGKAESSDVSCA